MEAAGQGRESLQFLVVAASLLPDVLITHIIRLTPPIAGTAVSEAIHLIVIVCMQKVHARKKSTALDGGSVTFCTGCCCSHVCLGRIICPSLCIQCIQGSFAFLGKERETACIAHSSTFIVPAVLSCLQQCVTDGPKVTLMLLTSNR